VSPKLGQSVTPKQLVFDDYSVVDEATVGEVGCPPAFGAVLMDPSMPPPPGGQLGVGDAEAVARTIATPKRMDAATSPWSADSFGNKLK